MSTHNLSRRGFLAQSLTGLLGAGLPVWYAREVLADEQASKPDDKKVAANDKITFGLIGSGDRSKQVLGDFRRFSNFQLVACCDVDKRHSEEIAQKMGGKVDQYKDFREICQRKDIDAMLVITPDHWHALPALEALKAGKDVYCEKPLTLTVSEGRPLIKAARAGKRVFQVGSQQRSNVRFRLACELARNGRVGKIQTIETRIGTAPTGGPFKTAPIPSELDWNFWLGPTPMVDYIPERCHYQFRWWYEYSGGKVTDWGAHHNDIAQWALGMDESGPISVASKGKQPNTPNGFNVHTTFEITYQYANGVTLLCKSDGENGVHIQGDKGWIFVSRSTIRASDEKILKEPLPPEAVRLYKSLHHQKNFLDCIKSREKPICDVEIGHRSVTVCHIGNISLRLGGRKLQWDPANEKFLNDDEANAMLSRPGRGEWKLES